MPAGGQVDLIRHEDSLVVCWSHMRVPVGSETMQHMPSHATDTADLRPVGGSGPLAHMPYEDTVSE